MPAPWDEYLFYPNRQVREIDNHYHLQMVATSVDQIVGYERKRFRLEQKAACENVRGFSELRTAQDRTNGILQDLLGTANVQLDRLNEGIRDVNEGIRDVNEGIRDVFGSLEHL